LGKVEFIFFEEYGGLFEGKVVVENGLEVYKNIV